MKKFFFCNKLYSSNWLHVNSVAMLGPLMSIGTSGGSIYQAGISYGTTTVVEKITGKKTSEHIISALQKIIKKRIKNKIDIYVNRY